MQTSLFLTNVQAGTYNFTKNDFCVVIVKDFAKLWVNPHKHTFYKRYFHNLLKLFKALPKT